MGPGSSLAAAVPEVRGASGGAAPVLLEVWGVSRAYARGAARERQLADRLEAEGWSVTRSAGSHSPHDLVACRAGYVVRYIQVKGGRSAPYAHFGPAERVELLEEAERAGAKPELCWWPADRKGPRFIPADAWPSR